MAPRFHERQLERVKLVKLANFKPAKMPEKTELGQLCQLGQLFSSIQIERNRLSDEIRMVMAKSVEVWRTLTPDFVARDDYRTEENEESEGLRRPARQRARVGFEVDRTRSNSLELVCDEKDDESL